MMRKIRGWKEDAGREKGRMKRMANVLIQGRASYRAAQTNKLELTLELEGAKARDDETEIGEAGGGGKGGTE